MTATLTLLEVRCSRCWNSNCFSVETVGSHQECRNCGNDILVPEATPERIARAEALLAEQPELLERPTEREQFDRVLSDQEIQELARKESYVPLDQMDFSGYPKASLLSRFIANLVDQFLLMVSMVLGAFMVAAMARFGLLEDPFQAWRMHHRISLGMIIVFHCIPAMLVMSQWVLLATSGQTIGKKLLMIRIVTMDGKLPGFLQGVVLRNWLRNLLYTLPFAGLIDCLFVLGDSKRAGHDWIAGTQVVANI